MSRSTTRRNLLRRLGSRPQRFLTAAPSVLTKLVPIAKQLLALLRVVMDIWTLFHGHPHGR